MRRLLRSACWVFLAWAAFVMTDYPARASADAIPSKDPVFNLPQEPDEFDRREVEAYYDWRNNMFFRVFKLASQESKPDFMTARRTYKVSVNQYGYEVAITFANPLFYWVDLDGNGEFEPGKGEMWIDVEEDGVNGNERLYDPMAPGEGPRGPVPMPPAPTGRSGQPL